MKRIFLVEDDQEIARNLIRLLSREGFAVTHAANQKETSVVLDEQRFDLALVDISLPDGNGFAVCTAIKDQQNVPVIFLTGRTDPESVKKVVALKPAGYLSKFLKQEDIKRKIDKFFEVECIGKK